MAVAVSYISSFWSQYFLHNFKYQTLQTHLMQKAYVLVIA